MKYICSLVAIASMFSLSACSGGTAKQALGLDRSAPDEFRVVSRPPLSVPPQFDLVPPSATATSPNQVPVSKQAETLLLGEKEPAPLKDKKLTKAEASLLEKAGATTVDSSIRNELVEEKYSLQRKEEEENEEWWNVLPGIGKKQEPTVDPKKEAERIEQNEKAGQPVTEGETPLKKSSAKSTLDYILGN